MDEVALLERPATGSLEWFMPARLLATGSARELMLHRLCLLSHHLRAIAVRDVLRKRGLDLRDWMVMAALDGRSASTQRELVGASNLDKVAVNRAAARLKKLELVSSHPNRHDGRSHHLELTPRGRQTFRECSQALAELEREALAQFDDAELDRLSGYIDRLMDVIEIA